MTATGLEPIPLLLVDDRTENLLALVGILDAPEYRLVTAKGGQEALRHAVAQEFAAILLDVRMPGMSGFEVAAHLRSVDRTRAVPILFLTAEADDAQEVFKGYTIGAVDYMVKPLVPEMVRAKVAVFADLYRQRREIERQASVVREVERREFELRLAELRVASDKRYRKLVEGIDHAIAWSAEAKTWRLTFASRRAEAILGVPIDGLLEEEFWQKHVPPDDRARLFEAFETALSEGIDQDCNHRMLAADGRVLWFHTGVSADTPVESPDLDGHAELHGISVDVTDLKRAEETAHRATQAREELLAIVSHDLRNLLSSIVLGADRLDRALVRPAAAAPTDRAIETILRAARRMDRLVGDLLDLASLQAGAVAIDRSPVDATELVHEALATMESVGAKKAIDLQGLPCEGLLVVCDRERILQVLLNLLGNAVKFTPESGRVVLSTEERGDEAIFTVTDTGPGVTDDQVPYLFERFWQASSKTGLGVGLGLSIAKRLIEAHGGRIWVARKAPPGACFQFSLPLADARSVHPGSALSATEAAPGRA